jgi:hypothetical protein
MKAGTRAAPKPRQDNRNCRRTLCAMLLLDHLDFRARAFVRLRRARYFSFACPKEKYPRENDTPLGACRACMPGKFVSRAGLFDRTPVRAKRSRHPCRLPCGPVVPNSPPHRGPGKSRMPSWTALFKRARASQKRPHRGCTVHRYSQLSKMKVLQELVLEFRLRPDGANHESLFWRTLNQIRVTASRGNPAHRWLSCWQLDAHSLRAKCVEGGAVLAST